MIFHMNGPLKFWKKTKPYQIGNETAMAITQSKMKLECSHPLMNNEDGLKK